MLTSEAEVLWSTHALIPQVNERIHFWRRRVWRTEKESEQSYQKFQHETEDNIYCHSFWVMLHFTHSPAWVPVAICGDIQMSLHHKPDTKSKRRCMEKSSYYNQIFYVVMRFNSTNLEIKLEDICSKHPGKANREELAVLTRIWGRTSRSCQHAALLHWDGRGWDFQVVVSRVTAVYP